jgi:hypothetical protein
MTKKRAGDEAKKYKKYMREYYQTHPEYRIETKERNKKNISEKRLLVLTYYSDGKLCCAKCGYNADLKALVLDHINNDGYKHRINKSWGGSSIWYFIIKNNFPEGFQVLCCNCNWIKEIENRKITYGEENHTTS